MNQVLGNQIQTGVSITNWLDNLLASMRESRDATGWWHRRIEKNKEERKGEEGRKEERKGGKKEGMKEIKIC